MKNRLIRAQERALEKLREESEELYQQAIEVCYVCLSTIISHGMTELPFVECEFMLLDPGIGSHYENM